MAGRFMPSGGLVKNGSATRQGLALATLLVLLGTISTACSVRADGPLGNGATFDTMMNCLTTTAGSATTFVVPLANNSGGPVVVDSVTLTGVRGITTTNVKALQIPPTNTPDPSLKKYGMGTPYGAGVDVPDLPVSISPGEAVWVLLAVQTTVDGSSAKGVDVRYHQGGTKWKLEIPSGVTINAPNACG